MGSTKTALVTGGMGFVGRHMTTHLSELGYDVTVVDNMVSKSSRQFYDWPKDLKDKAKFKHYDQDVRDFFRNNHTSFDVVFHLAAIVGGRISIEDFPITVAEDLSIDSAMYSWAARTRPGRVVFFSSSAAYPVKNQTHKNSMKLHEDLIDFNNDIGLPDLTYGWAKLTGEYLAKTLSEKYNIPCICYRPFSGYGTDQHDTYPFTAILNRVKQFDNMTPVDVWGSGEQSRDFIHITDCIQGVLKTMEAFDDGSAVNLGTGRGTSFNQLAKIMGKIVHNLDDIPIRNLRDKPEGVFYRVSNTELMRAVGFEPSVTLEEGISMAIGKSSDAL